MKNCIISAVLALLALIASLTQNTLKDNEEKTSENTSSFCHLISHDSASFVSDDEKESNDENSYNDLFGEDFLQSDDSFIVENEHLSEDASSSDDREDVSSKTSSNDSSDSLKEEENETHSSEEKPSDDEEEYVSENTSEGVELEDSNESNGTHSSVEKPSDDKNESVSENVSDSDESEDSNESNETHSSVEKPSDDEKGDINNNLSLQVFDLVNEERLKQGLSPLIYRSDIQKAADIRAKEIVKSFSHTRPSGKSCFTVFDDIGFRKYRSCGENIAYGYSNPKAVMNGWMNSSGHRANILNPSYTGLVVGCTEVGGRMYWVQLFVG